MRCSSYGCANVHVLSLCMVQLWTDVDGFKLRPRSQPKVHPRIPLFQVFLPANANVMRSIARESTNLAPWKLELSPQLRCTYCRGGMKWMQPQQKNTTSGQENTLENNSGLPEQLSKLYSLAQNVSPLHLLGLHVPANARNHGIELSMQGKVKVTTAEEIWEITFIYDLDSKF